MTDFVNTKIKDIAEKNHSRVDPSDNPHTEYSVYSFSAHDEGKKPDKKLGEEIGSSKYKVPDGCILVTKLNPRIPRVWKVADCDDESIASTEFVILKPKNKEMLDYLYAVLSSDSFFDNMSRITGGTSGSHQRVKQSDILDYEFSAPVFKKDRKKISDLISAIDEKIRLNREISELLEEIAESIYVSWFEEYEPYKDRYDSLSGKLGPYPEHFQEAKISEISSTEGGGTPDTDNEEFWNGDINWISPKEITNLGYPIVTNTERKITDEGLKSSSTNELDSDSILLTSRATVGEIAINTSEICTSQGFIGIEPDLEYKYLILEFLKNNREYVERLATGSTYDEISQSQLKNIKLPVIKDSYLSEFNDVCRLLYSEIKNLKQESGCLESLRGYLLPQLLSGEVEISEISTEPESNTGSK